MEAIAHAAAAGRAAELHALLAGVDVASAPALLGVSADSGLTPLHASCFAGSTTCAQLLVGARADINAPEANGGASPLCIAAAVGGVDCAAALIAMGAALDRAQGLQPRSASPLQSPSQAP